MVKQLIIAAALAMGTGVVAGSNLWAADDKDEMTMTIDQVPGQVRDTIKKEAGEGKIGDIEKKVKDGKTYFEADITVDGKKYELKVSDTGKLLSKKRDTDEKDDK